MELYPLVDGVILPEVYHFSFSGTHFEIFLNPKYWVQFVEYTGAGTEYSTWQGESFVPPKLSGGDFGQRGCACASRNFEGFMCIKIPAFVTKLDYETSRDLMRTYAHTLSSILSALQQMLYESMEQVEPAIHRLPQLFCLNTHVGLATDLHSAGLDLSLSPLSRRYLEKVGDAVVYEDAIEAMEEHYWRIHPGAEKEIGLFPGAVMVRITQNGVPHLHTVGECACLGAMPENFGDGRGCHLHSHNVDSVYQQFNLLVGVAYIWQAVRDGLRAGIQKNKF